MVQFKATERWTSSANSSDGNAEMGQSRPVQTWCPLPTKGKVEQKDDFFHLCFMWKVTEKGFILAALARKLCRELRNGQGYNGAGNSEKKEGPACVRALPFLVENGTVQ